MLDQHLFARPGRGPTTPEDEAAFDRLRLARIEAGDRVDPTTRTCKACGEDLDPTLFDPVEWRLDGRDSTCIPCRRRENRARLRRTAKRTCYGCGQLLPSTQFAGRRRTCFMCAEVPK